ncbi:MAG TPA: PQQ-binding-like beta-propeller repeat protein [Bacteroidales bacterium]|nr:PQQ-binding-like beta-propeller repeat protein [Bacteroidales bacterium]
MPEIRTDKLLTTIMAIVVFAITLTWWLMQSGPFNLVARVPGMDNRPPVQVRSDSVVIGEFYDSLSSLSYVEYGEWPRFRGSDFDNINKDTIEFSENWDSSGPEIMWKTSLGEGYAGPSVSNGRVYIMDYNERRKTDVLRCFSLATGEELWRRWYYVDLKRNHGYSRTIPAVTDKYVVTMGPRSHVMCVDPVYGRLLWSMDLEKKYGIPGWSNGRVTPDFYTGQCPLIDDDVAIIVPGVKALMIGIDCATGKVLWETPNPDSLKMSHGSVMPMVINGKRMYVYNAVGGVCGVSAEKADIGKLLWTIKDWNPATTAASPVLVDYNKIAVFGSYGAGGALIRIEFDGENYVASLVEKHKSAEGLASDQQTPVLIGDYIWTVMPENAGELKKQLVCYHKSDLRKAIWTSGKENRFGRGLGPYIVSGNKLYLLDDDCNLYMFRLENNKVSLLDKHKMLEGIEAWAPMAIAGKYLVLRDSRNMICVNISGKS